jgi:hypothetical protein
MPQPARPLEHQDPDKKSDEALRQEARSFLGDAPPLQLVAELLGKLRSLHLSWWTPDALRARWGATDRMRWYRTRPDLRQRVTTLLTGLASRAARKKTPEFQGALIDSVIDEGDVNGRAFEDAFDPSDLVVYGPVDEFWQAFMEKMPWADDAPAHQELCAWLFDALLADRSAIEGLYRKPILTAWEARTAIDGRVWHTRMPLEIRVAIDEARFQKQRDRSGEPFHAESDLSIAVSATIAASIPLRDLMPVFAAAEREMGFKRAARPEVPPTGTKAAPPAEAARAADPAKKAEAAPLPKAGEAPAPAPGAAAPAPRLSAPPPPPSVAPPPPSMAPSPSRPSYAPPPVSFGPQSAARRIDPAPPPAPRSDPGKGAIPPPAKSDPGRAVPPSPRSDPGRAAAPTSRAPTATIPDAFHHISGEEERTNPWDIPAEGSKSDESSRGDGHGALESGAGSKRRRSGKG